MLDGIQRYLDGSATMSGTTNDLHANLPPALQTPTTIITPIAAGMSGLSGVAALRAARMSGYVGTDAPIESVSSLGDLYAEMRNGTFDIRTARGQWGFGLALIGEGTPMR